MNKIIPVIAVSIGTVLIVLLTKHPVTSRYALHLTLLSIIVLIVYGYWIKKRKRTLRETKTVSIMIAVSILLFVGSTGLFLSPFFFTLYLLSILFGFVFSPAILVVFIVTLVILLSFNIGTVNIVYDFFIVFSLLIIIPLTFYLKKEYLSLKEAAKEVLIIKNEQKNFQNKVDELLNNKITTFAVSMRQLINDVKQLAFMIKKNHSQEEMVKKTDRIIASSEESLRLLQTFEEEATGNRLLKSPL